MKWLTNFLVSKNIPYGLAGVATGLYPLLFYSSKNFHLSNSWIQFAFLIFLFLIVPVLIFLFFKKFNRIPLYLKYKKQFLFFLSAFLFLFFIELILHASVEKILALITFIALIPLSFLLYKFHKQLIVFQLLLSIMGFMDFVPTLYRHIQIDMEWTQQPDDIESVVLKKKPNIYFIQPDGYISLSEMEKGHYNMDASEIRAILNSNGFTLYENLRSNYASTLSTNAAIFQMKHHYYNKFYSHNNGFNPQELLVSNNSVLSIFKNNGYKTHLLLHSPYFLMNHKKINYDYCNFSFFEIPIISTGFKKLKQVTEALDESYPLEEGTPHFFFIEYISPAHIPNKKNDSRGIEEEKALWKERVIQSNEVLADLISTINQNDKNALIIIMADHGGYIGYEYAHQLFENTQDRDYIYSVFGTLGAIKWPNNNVPIFNDSLKTSVNTFRIVFSHLSENEKYLNHLQDNGSYQVIGKGAPRGIYRMLDDKGQVDFKEVFLFDNE
ncbi:hypothetical protein KXJ69_12415 [Aureisphaera sp. CAU 1614]|uniref:Sulfatase N-terminal domain-containing protein n=1 Tax=Halomarinibacterium sedimenti TaxID=2857106 RepID=A0A9X1JY60_9FLAO|nr:hypothetical protein [Halomarinibacterium sedimenti]MBW2938913.1 hypothetical protein [Halomarinibacterium sedimenti]